MIPRRIDSCVGQFGSQLVGCLSTSLRMTIQAVDADRVQVLVLNEMAAAYSRNGTPFNTAIERVLPISFEIRSGWPCHSRITGSTPLQVKQMLYVKARPYRGPLSSLTKDHREIVSDFDPIGQQPV